MPIILCPNCRDKMQVAHDDIGERVVCPSCDHRFVARDDAPAHDDRGRGRSRMRDDDDLPRRKPKSNKLLWIILTLVIVFIVLPCAGCIGFGLYVNTAKQSFSGPWTDQSVIAADSSVAVTASFPSTLISNTLSDTTNNGIGSTLAFNNIDQNGSIMDAVCLIGYVDYPAGTLNPLDKGYLAIRREIADQHVVNPLVPPKIIGETTTNVYGYPAKEAKYSDDDGNFVLRVVHVNDRPRGSTVRLVVVLSGGAALKDADKQKFLNSVKIGKGK